MNITEMSKMDFASVPRLDLYNDWNKLAPDGRLNFNSFVVIPVENDDGSIDIHDSGWGCMEFCLIDGDMQPIGKVGGGCDVCNLDGIGGYGYKWYERGITGFPRMIPVHGWTFDLLPCGYLHVWTKRVLYLTENYVGSNFEPYSEDMPRG